MFVLVRALVLTSLVKTRLKGSLSLSSLRSKRFQRVRSKLIFPPVQEYGERKEKKMERGGGGGGRSAICRAAKTLQIFHGNDCYAG